MNKKHLSMGLAVVLFASYTLTAFSQSSNQLVNQRRGAMWLQNKYLGSSLAMVQDRAPYDAAAIQRNADYLAVLAQLPWDDFQPSTIGNANSKTKEEIYKDAASKFKAAGDTFKADVQKFVTAARGGDRATVGTAVRAVALSCNSCHDLSSTANFRFKVD